MGINEKTIRSLTEPGIYWDDEVPGFGLRVYNTGTKSFILQIRVHGIERKRSLGKWPGMTLRNAREIARQKYTMARAGMDPFKEEEQKKLEASHKKSGSLIKNLCDDFLVQWSRKRHKINTFYNHERRIEAKILPYFRNRRVTDIKRIDIQKFHVKVSKDNGPTEANRCLSLLHKMFECAIDWGYLPESAVNPAARIKRNPEKRREDYLSMEDLERLVKVLENEDIFIKNAIWLYLLTGLRKMELLTRKWSDLDLESKTLKFEDTKAGRPFYLPLSEEAVNRFRELPRRPGNPYIFPGRKAGSHWENFPRRAWARIKTAANLDNITIHSLRHTVASWLAADGVSLKIIGGILNQSSASITDRYAHLQADVLRGEIDRHSSKIIQFAKIQETY